MQLFSKIEGSGKPLIILHGFLGMSDNWKTLGTRYAQEGFSVHLVDLRNHGRSFHSNDFSYEAMSADLLSYCAELQLEKISIIGHSMGGKVAMFFATSYPEKVEKLIIADIGPKYYKPHHQFILEALQQVDFSVVNERGQVDEILKKNIPEVDTRQFLLKNLFWESPGKLNWRFNLNVLLKNQHIIGQAIDTALVYDKPVLFLRGGKSNYIIEEEYDQIKTIFSNASFAVIDQAGHWLHAEKPVEFFAVSVSFLRA